MFVLIGYGWITWHELRNLIWFSQPSRCYLERNFSVDCSSCACPSVCPFTKWSWRGWEDWLELYNWFLKGFATFWEISFDRIKNEKFSMKMIFFSKKTVIFIISDLFPSIRWKFLKSGKSLQGSPGVSWFFQNFPKL